MHAKNADMYPMQRQNLPNGDFMLTAPQGVKPTNAPRILNDTGFKMVMNQNARMAGSVPVWTPQTNTAPAISNADTEIKSDDFGFLDILDMLNPIQHIPLIGQAYRAITGDVIKPVAEVIGGAIFGGPIGAATGAVSAVVGDDIKQAFAGFMQDDRDTTIAITNLRSIERYNN